MNTHYYSVDDEMRQRRRCWKCWLENSVSNVLDEVSNYIHLIDWRDIMGHELQGDGNDCIWIAIIDDLKSRDNTKESEWFLNKLRLLRNHFSLFRSLNHWICDGQWICHDISNNKFLLDHYDHPNTQIKGTFTHFMDYQNNQNAL